VQDPEGDGQIVYLFLPMYKVCSASVPTRCLLTNTLSIQRGNFQDAINANVVNGRHFPEQEMVQLFRGTCLAVRAMHEYRPTTPQSAVAAKKAAAAASSRNGKSKQQQQQHDEDDDDERFPQAEGDAEGGYSYDGPSVPLVTKYRVEEEGDVVFDGDEEAEAHGEPGKPALEVMPYAHRDLKPG